MRPRQRGAWRRLPFSARPGNVRCATQRSAEQGASSRGGNAVRFYTPFHIARGAILFMPLGKSGLRRFLEGLEDRVNPSPGGLSESFDLGPSPTWPGGWMRWSNDGSEGVNVSSGVGVNGSRGAVASGTSATQTLAWNAETFPADTAVSTAILADSLIPAFVLARGVNLGSASPSYLAAVVTRGMTVELWEVVNGQRTILASLSSAAYVSGPWVTLSLLPQGRQASVMVQRLDTGQYLNGEGRWQSEAVAAIRANVSTLVGEGRVGFGRAARYAGPVRFDDFLAQPILPRSSPPPTLAGVASEVREDFNQVALGALPAGWAGWSSLPGTGFQTSAPRAGVPTPTLTSLAPSQSTAAARAWVDRDFTADVEVGAAIYLDTLIRGQVFARGRGLDTTTPSYYAVTLQRGLEATVVRVVNGVSTPLASLRSSAYFSGQWVTVRLTVEGDRLRVAIIRQDTGQYLRSNGTWGSTPEFAFDLRDGGLSGPGRVGVAREASFAGTLTWDDFHARSLTSTDTPSSPPLAPDAPRHFDHIRIAMLAYSGNPMGEFEQALLRTSVDLVVANTSFLTTIDRIAPATPQLLYTNLSNIYGELLLDWLQYADARGVSRETAFFHVAQATPFVGNSPSAQPVNWFWDVFRSGISGGADTDFTRAARGTTSTTVNWGVAGQAMHFGYTDPFREIHLDISRAASGGWGGVWEYASVNASGQVVWRPLALLSDGSAAFSRTGVRSVVFDPPADWRAVSLREGGNSLYYVRFRVTAGSSTTLAPVTRSMRGRDYVQANGSTSGVIPAFDFAADQDGDGYLNDAEYARRTPGLDARFVYESRMFYPYYGQMRFVTNPAGAEVSAWAADYHQRLLARFPLADGLFIDNASGRVNFEGARLVESSANLSANSARVVEAVRQAVAPRWVVANTVGGHADADGIAAASSAAFEEFLLRPLATNWSRFNDVVDIVDRRLAAPGSPYLIMDSSAQGGSRTDARTQMSVLAYYYLLADPVRTFLMFFGGDSPSTPWVQHWSAAAAVNIGQPLGRFALVDSGADPANPLLTYRVFAREYSNGLAVYKPLSYAQGRGEGTTADATRTFLPLNGTYRILNADGTLSANVVSSLWLRNGEGVVLVKA